MKVFYIVHLDMIMSNKLSHIIKSKLNLYLLHFYMLSMSYCWQLYIEHSLNDNLYTG